MSTPIAILGGSFDPPHIGHLRIALELGNALPYWRLVISPCAQNALKNKSQASAADRLQMLKLAMQPHPQLLLFDDEIKTGGISYTVDNLRRLRAKLGNSLPLFLLMGADSYNSLAQWREIAALPQLANLLVINRPGYQINPVAPDYWWRTVAIEEAEQHSHGCMSLLTMPELALASSQLRQLIASGSNVQYLLPEKVYEYIKQQRLYGHG